MRSRFSPTAVGGFELFFRPWMRGRVNAVRMAGLPGPGVPAGPLLLAANHVSWWDGFVLREVQRVLRPRAPIYTLMAEAELRRFPYLGRLGVMGIEGASPQSVARALRLLKSRLREHPDSVVVFFPQGRIWPSRRRPLGFRRGVELFAHELSTVVLPVGLHSEPLNTISPTFFVATGEPLDGVWRLVELERRVEAQLDAIHALLEVHGENAPLVWPGPHTPLPAAGELARGAR